MPKPNKIVIVDAYSLIFRAFFALPPLSTKEGKPTNAVYGFTTMLLKLLEEERPDLLVVAWDAPGGTFRHEEYKEYKATRPKAPPDLVPQFELVQEVVRAFNLPSFECPGYEADDVIAALARRASDAGIDTLVVTGDLDALQLVDDRIYVMMTRRGITDTKVYDAAAIRERWGITPEQVVDFKALKGDPSDNIPGVPGVGEKTAADLVRRFGTIEDLVRRADEIERPKIRDAILANAETLALSKRLTQLVADLALDFDPAAAQTPTVDRQAIVDLFERLEFRGLAAKFLESDAVAWSGDTAPAPAAGAPLSIATAKASSDVQAAAAACRESGTAAMRLVTTGADFERDVIVAIAIAPDPARAWIIPIADGSAIGAGDGEGLFAERVEIPAEPLPDPIAGLLADPKVCVLGHDLKSDLHMLRRHDARPRGALFDVMVADYLLNSTLVSPSLGDVARRCADITSWESEGPLEIAARQAASLHRIAARQRDELSRGGMAALASEFEMPLIPVLCDMEHEGICIDVGALEEFASHLAGRILQLEKEIFSLAGAEFKVNSPKQLQEVLYDRLKLPRGRRTKTGYSTDAAHLDTLAPDHEIVAKILSYREAEKLRNTYADALPKLVSPVTGRIHTTLNQAATTTGRLSSSEPNLQNIPIRDEAAREIRRAFVPSPGCVLVCADYSQIELRVLAHLASDPGLIEAFRSGQDIHARTASEVFGVPIDQVEPEQRRRAKVINFGLIYGMSEHRVSREFGVSYAEAREFVQRYFDGFPNVRSWLDKTIEDCRRDGYVTTLFGRRRYIPEIRAAEANLRGFAERTAVNAPIQGTAADIIKIAMVRLARRLEEAGASARMVLQVHDELIFDTPEPDVADLIPLVREVMAGAAELAVELVVDVAQGSNWADAKR
jgi:DNA polymerase-1